MRRLHRASSTLRRLPDWETNSAITAFLDRSEHLDFLRRVHAGLIDRCSNVPRNGEDLRRVSPAPIPEGLGSRLRVQLDAVFPQGPGFALVFRERRSDPAYAFDCKARQIFRVVDGRSPLTPKNLEAIDWDQLALDAPDGIFLIPNPVDGELHLTQRKEWSLRAGSAVRQDQTTIFECDFASDQISLISVIPARPASILFSGSRSDHGLLDSRLARPMLTLLEFIGGDHHVFHPVALSRAAGIRGQIGREQALHYAAPSGQRPLTIAETPWRSGAEFDEAVHEVAVACDLHHATLRLAELAADAETLVGQLVPATGKTPRRSIGRDSGASTANPHIAGSHGQYARQELCSNVLAVRQNARRLGLAVTDAEIVAAAQRTTGLGSDDVEGILGKFSAARIPALADVDAQRLWGPLGTTECTTIYLGRHVRFGGVPIRRHQRSQVVLTEFFFSTQAFVSAGFTPDQTTRFLSLVWHRTQGLPAESCDAVVDLCLREALGLRIDVPWSEVGDGSRGERGAARVANRLLTSEQSADPEGRSFAERCVLLLRTVAATIGDAEVASHISEDIPRIYEYERPIVAHHILSRARAAIIAVITAGGGINLNATWTRAGLQTALAPGLEQIGEGRNANALRVLVDRALGVLEEEGWAARSGTGPRGTIIWRVGPDLRRRLEPFVGTSVPVSPAASGVQETVHRGAIGETGRVQAGDLHIHKTNLGFGVWGGCSGGLGPLPADPTPALTPDPTPAPTADLTPELTPDPTPVQSIVVSRTSCRVGATRHDGGVALHSTKDGKKELLPTSVSIVVHSLRPYRTRSKRRWELSGVRCVEKKDGTFHFEPVHCSISDSLAQHQIADLLPAPMPALILDGNLADTHVIPLRELWTIAARDGTYPWIDIEDRCPIGRDELGALADAIDEAAERFATATKRRVARRVKWEANLARRDQSQAKPRRRRNEQRELNYLNSTLRRDRRCPDTGTELVAL